MLRMVQEKKRLLKTMDNRKGKIYCIWYITIAFVKTKREDRKSGRGRRRRSYLDQVREKVDVVSHQVMKVERPIEMVGDSETATICYLLITPINFSGLSFYVYSPIASIQDVIRYSLNTNQ